MKRTNLAVSALFLALGGYLIFSATRFPPGMGRLPGPGFFPGVVGAVIAALAAVLLLAALRGKQAPEVCFENGKTLAAAIALLLAYLLLWGGVNFVLRTAVLLVLFLRLAGERWRSALVVSLTLTIAVVLAFQYGLRVDLR